MYIIISLSPADCGISTVIDPDYEYGDYAESGEDSYDEEEEVDSSIRGGGDYEASGEGDYEASGEGEVEEEPIDEDG